MSNSISLVIIVFLACAAYTLASYFGYRKAVEVEEIRRAEYRDDLTELVNSYMEPHTEKD